MKSKKVKQNDLDALTQQFQDASAAMVVGFNKLTVAKDQELREQLRNAGAEYKVVKNTLARRAAKGTPFEQAEEHFKGVTAVAFVKDDGIALSKTLTKFVKDNPEVFSFKAGIVEGKVIDLKGIQTLASLPSKEELMSKLLFLLQAPAQRLATVINAIPRNLAVVIKLAGETKEAAPEATAPEATAPEAAPEVPAEATSEAPAEAAPEAAVEAAPTEATPEATEATPEATTEAAPEAPAEAAPVAEATPEAPAEAAPEAPAEATSEVPVEAAPEATEATPEAPAEAAPEVAAEAAPEEAAPEAEPEEKPEA
ncbi:MAG TPA: 50S ribosomal protein L10 [Pyrinomonadaceae bacterium]|jgi:large subunit ribosomal protein L10|nr:50S ribosomal protein L10 [Pyrinomonadaceae bacterium]